MGKAEEERDSFAAALTQAEGELKRVRDEMVTLTKTREAVVAGLEEQVAKAQTAHAMEVDGLRGEVSKMLDEKMRAGVDQPKLVSVRFRNFSICQIWLEIS